MGIKGLFNFLKYQNIQGTINNCSIEELTKEISSYRNQFNEKPKILINIYSFNNYYEQFFHDVILGCRFNTIKADFELYLSTLKNAGAELFFTSKMTGYLQSDEGYKDGMKFVAKIEEIKSVKELTYSVRKDRSHSWNELTIIVLTQAAQKFGEFRENDCRMLHFPAGDVKVANDEKFFAIIGLNTYYLLYEGSWRYFYPVHETNEYGQTTKSFKEYDKNKILGHFDLDYNQMHLLGVLGGKLFSTLEYIETLKNYFSSPTNKGHFQDFHKMIDFIHNYAPRNSFPLSKLKIEEILKEIFGFINDDLLFEFELSLDTKPRYYVVENRDEEVSEILRKNPFCFIAERIMNDFPIYIYSYFLDVKKTDMKSLKDLTLPWIQRLCGLLLRNIDDKEKRIAIYRIDEENADEIEIEPNVPAFEIPPLKQMLLGEMSDEDKFKFLSFLIDDTVDKDDLKKIPKEFMMHVIILMHLVKNESMELFEAHAIIKTLRDEVPRILIYPLEVDIRAFRVSALYQTMYLVLLNCLHAVGLKDFVCDFTLDNVVFQNNYIDLKNIKVTDENIFEKIMDIVLA